MMRLYDFDQPIDVPPAEAAAPQRALETISLSPTKREVAVGLGAMVFKRLERLYHRVYNTDGGKAVVGSVFGVGIAWFALLVSMGAPFLASMSVYIASLATVSPLILRAVDFVDRKIQAKVNALRAELRAEIEDRRNP